MISDLLQAAGLLCLGLFAFLLWPPLVALYGGLVLVGVGEVIERRSGR